MTWFRVDDTFALHPKVIAAGNAAVGLWIRCGCWSAAQLTDGRIPHGIAAMFGTAKDAVALERAGLWRSDGDAWIIDDWLEYQPSAAETLARRRERAEAGRRGGVRSGQSRRGENEANAEAVASRLLQPNTKQLLGESLNPDPTRPDPTHVTNKDDDSKSVSARRKSSSSVDEVIELIVAGLAHQAGKTGNQAWRNGTARNKRAEVGADIAAALAQGHSPADIAARYVDPVHIRLGGAA